MNNGSKVPEVMDLHGTYNGIGKNQIIVDGETIVDTG